MADYKKKTFSAISLSKQSIPMEDIMPAARKA